MENMGIESEVQQGTARWEGILWEEVLKGPSAITYRINHLCHTAHKSGLLPTDGKRGLIREVAEVMNSAKSEGFPLYLGRTWTLNKLQAKLAGNHSELELLPD